MTPGPTPVPDTTRLDLAEPMRHHRTDEFRALLREVVDGLRYVFQTCGDVAVLTSSGTGAMEACVAGAVPAGGTAIVLDSGKFAHRWAVLCERFGIEAVPVEVPWGTAFKGEHVAEALEEYPGAQAVFATLSESSTGVGHDIEAIGRTMRGSDALLVVDAVSGAGAMECRMDAWGIDLLAVGSQKALMLPPGLAFVAISDRAWDRIESFERPAFYFDLSAYRKAWENHDTPYTPAISLVRGLAANLRQIRQIGIETIWQRCRRLGAATRAGITALGFELVAERPADGLTAAYFPRDVDSKRFLSRLEERFGIKLAGGQGPLQGKICRISHMGAVDEVDILGTLAAMELILHEQGKTVTLGRAVGAASAVLAEPA